MSCALTQRDPQIRAYVNGVLKGTTSASGHITSGTVPLYIGSDTFGDHFAGAVDEVALYSFALTPAEALQHFHAGRSESSGTAVVHGVSGAPVKRQEPASAGSEQVAAPFLSLSLSRLTHVAPSLQVDVPPEVNDLNGDGVIDIQDFQLALARLTGDDVSCFEVAPLAPPDENGVQQIYTLLVDGPVCPPSRTNLEGCYLFLSFL